MNTLTDPRAGFRAMQRRALAYWLARGAPVLPARRDGDYLTVVCPWCESEHRHGRADGHRLAHCRDPRSPLHATSYILAKVPSC